jgi:hypothetical protein
LIRSCLTPCSTSAEQYTIKSKGWRASGAPFFVNAALRRHALSRMLPCRIVGFSLALPTLSQGQGGTEL